MRDISDFCLLPWPSSQMEEGAKSPITKGGGGQGQWGGIFQNTVVGKRTQLRGQTPSKTPRDPALRTSKFTCSLEPRAPWSLCSGPCPFTRGPDSPESHTRGHQSKEESCSPAGGPAESLERGPQLRHKAVKPMRWFQVTP